MNVKVAVRQGNILALPSTELNEDLRWHDYFLGMLKEQ